MNIEYNTFNGNSTLHKQVAENEEKKKEKSVSSELPIVITSPQEYLQIIEKHPIEEIPLDKNIEEWNTQRKLIESKLANDRVARQMEEYVKNGIVKEIRRIGANENFDIPHDPKYFDYTIPVWNENGDISEYVIYQGKLEDLETKKAIREEIILRYEQEYDDKWLYEEQEKEKELREKVKNREMVYLGELTDDEYFTLRKKGIPISNFKKVVIFDLQNNPIMGRRKIFAKV